MWAIVAIPVSTMNKGHCPTHLSLMKRLIRHQILSLNVVKPTRPWRSIITLIMRIKSHHLSR